MDINALNQQMAATLLSVTPRSLRDWEKAGEAVPRNPDGSYPGPALVAWYVVRQSGGEALNAVKERARKDKESADKLAFENAVTRGDLARMHEADEWFGGHIERCRSRLIQLPDAIGQFIDPTSAPVVIGHTRRLVYEALAELATDSAETGSGSSGAVAAAADPDGESVGGSPTPAFKRGKRRAGSMAN